MDARWSRGESVDREPTLRRAAEEATLDPGELLAASHDTDLREKLQRDIKRRYEDDGVFGVPMLLLPDGSRFWGHDRMVWALEQGHLEP